MKDILNEEQHRNYKSILLEHCQGCGLMGPEYEVTGEQGPDHAKVFTVVVKVNKRVLGSGQGRSKKRAEQLAAKEALKQLHII